MIGGLIAEYPLKPGFRKRINCALIFVSTVSVLHDRKLSHTRNRFLLWEFLQRPSSSTASCAFHTRQTSTDFPNDRFCETMRLRFLVNEAFGLPRSIIPCYCGTLTRRLSQYNDGGLELANFSLRLHPQSQSSIPQNRNGEMNCKKINKISSTICTL